MRVPIAIIVIALFAGCGEKPPRMEPSSERAAKSDQHVEDRRQRTLGQSESERIYQQGTLR